MSQIAATKLLALNKVDVVAKPNLLPLISRYAESALFEEILPISALTGDNCKALLNALWSALPEGEPIYDAELLTVHPERFLVAELIREKVLLETRDELPHSTAVTIDHWEDVESGKLTRIYASILVERAGQKAILIGKGGAAIKKIGTLARHDLEDFLGRRVYLDLRVREERKWRENQRVLAGLDREIDAVGQ